MGDISTNFNRSEMKCHCNSCNCDTVDAETLKVIQEVRDHFGAVKVHCCHRCILHNAEVGGVSDSHHLSGRAIDFSIDGVKPLVIAEWIDNKYPDKYGIGCYDSFVHIDTKSGNARRWSKHD